MVCSITCSIAAAFIIGKIYFYNATINSQVVKHYRENYLQICNNYMINYQMNV